MKKFLSIALALLVAVGVCGFTPAKGGVNKEEQRTIFETLFSTVANIVSDEPEGTVYGLTENRPDGMVVNTPIGEYTVKKERGGLSFLGLWAKVESKRGATYVVDSSVGKFKVDLRKCTVTKL